MTRAVLFFVLLAGSFCFRSPLGAQQRNAWEIEALSEAGSVVYDFQTGIVTATNGVLVRYGPAVLTADSVTVYQETGEVVADGRVRIQRDQLVWASEHVRYNFKTQQIQAQQFRTGQPPLFVGGEGLHADLTNRLYAATNAVVTTDDVESPAIRLHAKEVRILPGDKIQAKHAVAYAGNVPVFYFPFYSRRLGDRVNHFNLLPGYRSSFGPFLLTGYRFYLNDELDGELHLDYRVKRGVGVGPDLNFNYGKWGQGNFKFYYLYDTDPNIDNRGADIPHNRDRVHFEYLAHPYTNFSVRSMIRYQSDTNVVREFRESEYRDNPQPNTYLDINKFWNNFSLDVYTQPRLNDFLETVERLPDVRLTGYRQQIGASPLYYESESSVGYYRRLFPEPKYSTDTNLLDFAAGRADTYHQLTLPYTFFGWLNVSPRVGGRFTWYSDASGPGATDLDEQYRGVFNTGAEVSFKASRLWTDAENRFFQIDGLRHIVQPSINYVYVPRPSELPQELPQFDYELPSLRLLPIEFPDYNAIDSVNSDNVLRLGLRNKLQTKRGGELATLLSWDLYTDWRLVPRSDQERFSDVFSDLLVLPWSWLRLESLTRVNPNDGSLSMSFNSLTLQPNNVWSWSVSHFYLRDDFTSPIPWGYGNDLISTTIFYKLNENWGFRALVRYDLKEDLLREHAYSIYRDLRSWTAALTLRVRKDPDRDDDVTVALTFSVKAFPRFGVHSDSARPHPLWGG